MWDEYVSFQQSDARIHRCGAKRGQGGRDQGHADNESNCGYERRRVHGCDSEKERPRDTRKRNGGERFDDRAMSNEVKSFQRQKE